MRRCFSAVTRSKRAGPSPTRFIQRGERTRIRCSNIPRARGDPRKRTTSSMAVKEVGRVAEVTLQVTSRPLELAATLVSEALKRVGPGARLGIPGGSALGVLRLVREALAPELWSSLRLTWVDERIVPVNDAASNRGDAQRSALSKEQPVALELPLVLDGENAAKAVERVTAQFARDFGGALDVALLGLGEDGHIASLFPGNPALDSDAPVIAIHDSPKPPSVRLTL